MDGLAAFLAARLDEDEETAKAAQAPSPWKAAGHESDNWIVTDATGEPLIYDEGTPTLEEARHIARHDPARVLREVAAKQAIIAMHGETWRLYRTFEESGWPGPASLGRVEASSRALRYLAAVYSDHPDYRAEWKP